jgi:hypothetical protein
MTIDGVTTEVWLTREQLLCMVSETIHQPKPGVRGPKPTPWTIAYQRLEQMRRARDAIRSKGDEVTKQAILDWLGSPGHPQHKTTIDRWLDAVPMTWEAFRDEGINVAGSPESLEGQGPEPNN